MLLVWLKKRKKNFTSVKPSHKYWHFFYFSFLFLSFVFLGLYLWHMEVPRLVLSLPTCATATAMRDPSHVFDLHHSSWQHQILNPLSEARG